MFFIETYGSVNAGGDCYFYNVYPRSFRDVPRIRLSEVQRTSEQKREAKLRRKRREIENACGFLLAMCRPRFYTFTLPGHLRGLVCKNSGLVLNTGNADRIAGVAFSMAIENLKKNYGLCRYIWVKEYQKNGNPHYHALLEIEDLDLPRLSAYWSDFFGHPKKTGSVEADRVSGKYIDLIKYLAKYLTKRTAGQGRDKKGKGFSMCRELQPTRRPICIEEGHFGFVPRGKIKQINEYVSVYTGPEITEHFRAFHTSKEQRK